VTLMVTIPSDNVSLLQGPCPAPAAPLTARGGSQSSSPGQRVRGKDCQTKCFCIEKSELVSPVSSFVYRQ
jgi:hypothetical protein